MVAGRIDVVADAAQAANAVASGSDTAGAVEVPGVPSSLAPGIFAGIAPGHVAHGAALSGSHVAIGGHASAVDQQNSDAVAAYIIGNADNQQALSSIVGI